MEKTKEYLIICLVGAIGYSIIEILWRGYTHWTMSITGGIGFLLLYLTDLHMQNYNILFRALAGTAILTLVELVAGCIVNLIFRMGVWDYSSHAGNLLGQICPFYCMLWFLLCISVMPLSRLIHYHMN